MDARERVEHAAASWRRTLGDRLVAVALFGSHARGEARPDSDVDVFLLVEGLPEDGVERGRTVQAPLDPLLAGPLSVLARTPAEFERDLKPLYLDLALDASIVHDRDGYLAGKLALVRARLAEAGLRRDPDLFWRWSRPPTRADWAIHWDGVAL